MKRKWYLVGVLIIILLVTLTACGNDVGKDENIEFSDVTFKKYVLKALGKNANESITYEEAEKLEKLNIDRSYRTDYTFLCPSGWRGANTAAAGVITMDISDIKYFTGLKELIIDNTVNDRIMGWENIERCPKLEKIKWNYFEGGQHVAFGSKLLFDIVKQLPALKTLDLSSGAVSDSTISQIKKINSSINVIENNDDSSSIIMGLNLGDIDYVYDTKEKYIIKDTTLIIAECKTDKECYDILDSIKADNINTVFITSGRAGSKSAPIVLDCEKLLKFTKLEALYISKRYQFSIDMTFKNLDKLANLEYLKTLCIFGDFDGSELVKLNNLDTISIRGNRECVDISGMNNIKIASVMDDVKLPSSVEHVTTMAPELLNGLKNLKSVADCGVDSESNDYIKSNFNLKYIYCFRVSNDYIDLSGIKNAKNLEYLYIKNKVKNYSSISELTNLRVVSLVGDLSEGLNIKKMSSEDSLSYLDISANPDRYSVDEIRNTFGDSNMSMLQIQYGLPIMRDMYKKGITNSFILYCQNSKDSSYKQQFMDTFGKG